MVQQKQNHNIDYLSLHPLSTSSTPLPLSFISTLCPTLPPSENFSPKERKSTNFGNLKKNFYVERQFLEKMWNSIRVASFVSTARIDQNSDCTKFAEMRRRRHTNSVGKCWDFGFIRVRVFRNIGITGLRKSGETFGQWNLEKFMNWRLMSGFCFRSNFVIVLKFWSRLSRGCKSRFLTDVARLCSGRNSKTCSKTEKKTKKTNFLQNFSSI